MPRTDENLFPAMVAAAAAAGAFLAWRLIGILVLFSRIRRDDLLSHPLRSQLMELIEAEPGLYVSELARRSGRSRNAIVHHLEAMAKAGLVQSLDGPQKRYFAELARPATPETGLRPTARKVLALAQAASGSTLKEIATLAGLPYGAVYYHARTLERAGLVLLQDDGELRIRSSTNPQAT